MAIGTTATVAAYLTAAQTAFDADSFAEAKKQITLGMMELQKLPSADGLEGEQTSYRQSFTQLLDIIQERINESGYTSRRSVLRGV